MSKKTLKGAMVVRLRDVGNPANLGRPTKSSGNLYFGDLNSPANRNEVFTKPRNYRTTLHIQYSISYMMEYWAKNPEYDGCLISSDTVVISDQRLSMAGEMKKYLYQELTNILNNENWFHDIDMSQSYFLISYNLSDKEIQRYSKQTKKILLKESQEDEGSPLFTSTAQQTGVIKPLCQTLAHLTKPSVLAG